MHVGKKKKKKGKKKTSICPCTAPICCLLRFLPHWCAAKRHPPTITASPPLTFVNHCSACDSENIINNTCCKRGFVFYISNFHGNVEIAELLIKAKIKWRRNEKKKTEANAVAGPHQRKKTQTQMQLITAFLSNVSENLTTHILVTRARNFTLRVKWMKNNVFIACVIITHFLKLLFTEKWNIL